MWRSPVASWTKHASTSSGTWTGLRRNRRAGSTPAGRSRHGKRSSANARADLTASQCRVPLEQTCRKSILKPPYDRHGSTTLGPRMMDRAEVRERRPLLRLHEQVNGPAARYMTSVTTCGIAVGAHAILGFPMKLLAADREVSISRCWRKSTIGLVERDEQELTMLLRQTQHALLLRGLFLLRPVATGSENFTAHVVVMQHERPLGHW